MLVMIHSFTILASLFTEDCKTNIDISNDNLLHNLKISSYKVASFNGFIAIYVNLLVDLCPVK